jgi:hypothetical protein
VCARAAAMPSIAIGWEDQVLQQCGHSFSNFEYSEYGCCEFNSLNFKDSNEMKI